MVNKAIRIILVFALIFSTTACYSTKILLPEEITVKQRQPIDHVILQNGKRVNLENGFIKDGNIYGDVIRTISVQSIVEAYDIKGNIITSTALAFQSQRSDFNRFLGQIESAKLATGETVNFLKVKDFKDGVITVLVERESQLFTSDEIYSIPFKPERLSIDAVILKDGRRIVLQNGFIMNGKVYEKKIVLRRITLKSIVEAYNENGQVISGEDIAYHADKKDFIKYTSGIVKVKLDTDEVLNFEKVMRCKDGEMIVLMEEGNALFSLSEVSSAQIESGDAAKTLLAIFGIIGGVILAGAILIAATKESCPFVYSYNGEGYIFDGEPYGGAICRAFKRTDLSKLDHLAPANGSYKLILTNEVNEIQYTDQFRLLVVDHPEDSEVLQDGFNNLYTISTRIKPVKVMDGKGKDLHRHLKAKDNLIWQSNMENKNPERRYDLRDDVYITFIKPDKVKNAKLIVYGGTTLWGSYMLKIISELHGKDVRKWYDSFKNPLNLLKLNQWIDQTGTYRLGVDVKTANGWQRRGLIFGGGPLINEERIVQLDTSDITGKELTIKISPPAGFWQFDSFCIDYSDEVPIEVQEISATSIYDDMDADITSILDYIDEDYCVMPFKGQKAFLMFPVPETIPGMKRSLFAKVNGYYDIYLDDTGEPQVKIIEEIESDPGFILKYSLQKYLELRK